MTDVSHVFDSVPGKIQAFGDQLLLHVPQATISIAVVGGLWRFTASTERVVLTLDYKQLSRGRLCWAHSTLSLDGQRVPLQPGYHYLVNYFRDPDGSQAEADLDDPAYPLPDADPADAPDQIRDAYQQTVRKPTVDAVHLGHSGTRWTMTITIGAMEIRESWMVLIHHRNLKPRVFTKGSKSIQVFMGGEDVSEQYADRTDAIMSQLHKTNRSNDAGPKAPTIRAASTAARSNAVETRKSTVNRT